VASVASTIGQAREEIAANPPDILLVDIQLPDGSGLDLLDGLDAAADPEVVLITGNASVETAVDALRRGVTDYLTKPVDFARLKVALASLARTLEMKGQIGTLRTQLRPLGRSETSTPLLAHAEGVRPDRTGGAPTPASSSRRDQTGKEVVARTIRPSRRSKQASFIDCGPSPRPSSRAAARPRARQLHRRDPLHKGLSSAPLRTLFLDEITEMPAEPQSSCSGCWRPPLSPVWGSQAIGWRASSRTNRRLEDAMAAGKLRRTAHRLNVFPMPSPPRRERGDDSRRRYR
jgi:DNA-binding NtrC family response regulator